MCPMMALHNNAPKHLQDTDDQVMMLMFCQTFAYEGMQISIWYPPGHNTAP